MSLEENADKQVNYSTEFDQPFPETNITESNNTQIDLQLRATTTHANEAETTIAPSQEDQTATAKPLPAATTTAQQSYQQSPAGKKAYSDAKRYEDYLVNFYKYYQHMPTLNNPATGKTTIIYIF